MCIPHRFFARRITYTGSDLFSDQKTINPTPVMSPAEEFDAYKYKMRAKYENQNAKQWYDKTPARSIFRFDPEFPEFTNEYNPLFQGHQDELLLNHMQSKK